MARTFPKRVTPWWNRPSTVKLGLSLFILIGAALLAGRIDDYLTWRASQSWTPTPGEVTRIAKPRGGAPEGKASGGFGAPRTAPAKWVTFDYTYAVGGTTYTSNKVSYAISGDTVPVDWLSALPQKGPATVRVDPKDPSRSVLRVGDPFEYWGPRVGVGLFMVLGGLVRLAYVFIEGS